MDSHSMTENPDTTPSGVAQEATVLSDEEIVGRVCAGERDLFELLLRRYNQRVYRTARAVLRNDAEAEDVTQEAWLRAFVHLDQFEGRARFSTWLTQIALHEAWSRMRRSKKFEDPDVTPPEDRATEETGTRDPETDASGREVRSHLESAVEGLPDSYRLVFVLREIEELSTAETAASLQITEDVVKTRLHRARAMLRRDLLERAGPSIARTFPFLGSRCDGMVERVMTMIRTMPTANPKI
jgi:RNA polymerase sigma-70 factor (ECF subfamily)